MFKRLIQEARRNAPPLAPRGSFDRKIDDVRKRSDRWPGHESDPLKIRAKELADKPGFHGYSGDHKAELLTTKLASAKRWRQSPNRF